MKELIDFCMHHNGSFRIVMLNRQFNVMLEVPVFNHQRKRTEYASFTGVGKNLDTCCMNSIVACERFIDETVGIQAKLFKL